MEIFEKLESEVSSYCRSFPAIFDKAYGEFMYDEFEHEYIDFFCGAGALNFGHNHNYIKERIINFLQSYRIAHGLDMYTVAKRGFIEKFEKNILAKRALNYKLQFTAPTGTNAVEAALKLARKVKKRPVIFSLTGAFHGMTLGSLALTGDRMSRAGAGVPLNNVVKIPSPSMFPNINTIDYIATILENDHSGIDMPAAIIVETVQAEGGVYPLDKEYLKQLRRLCDKYDILLIIDDVQVGVGRCGTYFSFEEAGIVPDMVVLSKSLSGYGFPMSLLLIKPELDIWKPGEHNGTFRGNQIAFVSASAAIDLFYMCDIENEVKRKSTIISKFLNEKIANKCVAIRGKGMIYGVEFSSGQDAKLVQKRCFQNALIMECAGESDRVLKIMPSLLIKDEILLKGLEILNEAII